MKITGRIAWVFTVLIVRTPLALFVNMLLPLVFFVFYADSLARASGPQIAELTVRLVTLGALSNGLLGLTNVLVMMREQDILRRYHLSPISSVHMVCGRLLANYAMFVLVILLQLGAAQIVFGVPLLDVLPQLVLVFTLGYFATAGIGLMIAAVVNTMQDAQVTSQIAFFLLLFVSGIGVPLSVMPGFFQRLAAFVPPALTIIAANALVSRTASLAGLWQEVLGLALIAAVTLGLATAMFRWEKEAKVSRADRMRAAVILVPLLVTGLLLNSSASFRHRVVSTSARSSGGPSSK